MPTSVQNCVPSLIETGDDYAFTLQLTQFPATLYNAKLGISQLNAAPLIITATTNADGRSFNFAISAAQTTPLQTGSYDWAVYAFLTATSARTTARGGKLSVIPGLLATGTPSQAQQMVAQLSATLATLNASTFDSTNINSQLATRKKLKEVQEQLVYWQSRVIKEQNDIDVLRGAKQSGNFPFRPAPAAYLPPFGNQFYGPY